MPDDLIIDMVRSELNGLTEVKVLFNGFPRNPAQATQLDGLLEELDAELTAAVVLEVSQDEVVRRLLQRSAEQGRSDDNEATIRHRLNVYEEQTQPLLDYYEAAGKLHRVDGSRSVEEVGEQIRRVLS